MGVGKSVVASRFAEHGARVVTADRIARDLVGEGGPVLDRLVDAFGPGILRDDGTLDRRRLAELAFASEESLERLNRIVHPPLVERILERIASARGEEGVLVVDAALLAEWGILDAFDVVVLVTSPMASRLERLERCGYARADATARIAAQIDPEELGDRADIIIRNEGTIHQLEARADEVWRALLSMAEEAS
jgi:dephospho-CoA kinase